MSSPFFSTDQLCVSYGKQIALDSASFHAQRGTVTGIIGANGSGKSTLLKAIAGIIPFQSGSVELEGQPISTIPASTLARRIAYLPQNADCSWPLTARRVVELGRIPHLAPWQKLEGNHAEAIHRAMADMDVSHLADRSILEISGGEALRVLMARALAGQPELLLADEPLSGLDPLHSLKLMRHFQKYAHSGNCVLVVLHDLTLASRFCDQILLLSQGRVIAFGTPESTLTDAHLQNAYSITVRRLDQAVVPWDSSEPKSSN